LRDRSPVRRIIVDELTRIAIERGQQQAADVLAFRSRALEERVAAVARSTARAERTEGVRGDEAASPDEDLVRAVGGTASAGVLIAEGDSWFDYPWNDVIELLEDHHAYDVESVAYKGDTVEDMAYSGGQLEEFTRRLEKLLRRNDIPRAILLSGGGNDVAGPEFRILLNHARSPVVGLNQQVVSGVIDERIRFAYVTIISAVTRICEERTGRLIPILVHGYDYPVPDGRGFWGGWSLLPGPWLEPGFRAKGYESLDERKKWARDLITHFNKMLESLPGLPEYSHVRYVNLLGTLSGEDADYTDWWDNELHPTKQGFIAVTEKIAAELSGLP
jgi:lysophospholipase L1-like esterase